MFHSDSGWYRDKSVQFRIIDDKVFKYRVGKKYGISNVTHPQNYVQFVHNNNHKRKRDPKSPSRYLYTTLMRLV